MLHGNDNKILAAVDCTVAKGYIVSLIIINIIIRVKRERVGMDTVRGGIGKGVWLIGGGVNKKKDV